VLERLLGSFPEVIQLLRDDHKLVRALFAQYARAKNGEKPQIAHRIIRELTIHSIIEERVIYPAFRAVFQDPQMIYEAVEEHQLVRALLNRARQLDCAEAWVLTDRANEPAMRLYASCAGRAAPRDQVMYTFELT